MTLSVIIPVYNTKEYLYRCIEPMVRNIVKDIEVIFVNDGSTDGSLEILKNFEEKYDFVNVINQENQGLSVARNVGIRQAKGDYFILLDSDDWLEWENILKIHQIAVRKDLELVGFKLQFVNQNGEIIGVSDKHPLVYEKKITGKEAVVQGYHPSSACLFLYKTSFIIDNNLEFYKGIMQEDVEFTLRILLNANSVLFTDKIGYNYFRRSDSMTTTLSEERIEKYLLDSILVANEIKKYILQQNSEDVKHAIEKNYNSIIWNLLWRFIVHPQEISYKFKLKCIKKLKKCDLYPIKGSLKTSFQNKSRYFFNMESLFLFVLRMRN